MLAVAFFALLALHAGHPTRTEKDIAALVHSLPNDARSFTLLIYNLLALWALAILVVAVAVARRWRLARDLAVAGGAAWILGRLAAFVVRQTDLAGAFRVVFDPIAAPRFPLVRVSIAVALIVVAGPYLTRPARRIGQGLVIVLALAAMYLGRAAVADVLGAFVLGWGTAAAVRYGFGTRVGRPSLHQVEDALQHLGLDVRDVEPASRQPLGRAVFRGTRDGRPIRIVALGRDEADTQLLSRTWHFIAYKDSPPNLLPTRRQQVEYEAYVELLASQAGVRAPAVISASSTGALALLVDELPSGPSLGKIERSAATDALLDRVWRELAALRSARIAHGALDGDHVVVDPAGPTVVGWDRATTSANSRQLAGDVAQLLAATSVLVGPERAVSAARAVLGGDALAAALPWLEPTAVTAATREVLDEGAGSETALEELRGVAAREIGTEVPQLRQLYRVHPRQLLMAVGALVAVGVLLSRIGNPVQFWDTVRNANWGLVALAFIAGLLSDAGFAVAFLGTVPIRLPLWSCVELQTSMSFSNLAVPVAADTAIQVRFLQKNGLDLASAIATGGVLSSVTEIIVQGALFVVALWLSPTTIHFGKINTDQIVVVALIAVFVLGVAVAVVASVRRIRRVVLPPIIGAARTMWDAMSSPGRIALIAVGNVFAHSMYAVSLLACLAAFGHPVDFWTLLALNIGISLIASLVPIPGGGTAVSAVGLSGMLVAVGVAAPTAAAAVLTQQLAVSYAPAVAGWFAANDLARRGLL